MCWSFVSKTPVGKHLLTLKTMFLLCVFFLFFSSSKGHAEELSSSYVIDNFFKGKKIDSIEGIWGWETSTGKYEGAIIRLDRLSDPEKIRARFGKSIQYACFLTKPMKDLQAGTLKMILKSPTAGMYDGYYIMYKYDYHVGYDTNEIPFRVSVISENTLAFGTISSDGGRRLNEATRVYPKAGSLLLTRDESFGTGFIVAPGIVATTYSNVASADSITLQFQHGSAKARLIARDSYADLALLEVVQEGSRTFMGTPIPIGDIRLVETDNRIVSPTFEDVAGFLEKRLLKGRITQKTGQKGDPRVFQTDLPAGSPRNGAPVLNEDFQVIGILVDVAKNPFFKTSAMIPEGSSYVVKINNFFNLAASCRECPKLMLTETNSMINELTVFYSVVLVRAEGTK